MYMVHAGLPHLLERRGTIVQPEHVAVNEILIRPTDQTQ
jgi:hypothetical protein